MSENKVNQIQSKQKKGAITGNKYDDDPNIKTSYTKLSAEYKKKKND